MPSTAIPVDWHKVQMNNWSQYGFTVDNIKIHLNQGNSPKMDGYELYEKLKKIDDKVNVCFLTASERYKEEHRPSFLSSNSTSFIIKPITVDDLVKKVNEMIKQK